MTQLVFGPGTHVLAQTAFTPAEQPVSIIGAGKSQTTLIAPAGLAIAFDNLDEAPELRGFTLATQQANAGTAIAITGPVAPTSVAQGPRLADLEIIGDDESQHYWTRGIRLVDVWNPTLRDINVKGKNEQAPPFSMLAGIEFERTQVFDAENIDVYHAQDGILQLGATYGEGVSIRNFNLVGVNRGIDLKQGSGYVIGDGHINAFHRGITISKTQITLENLLIYKTHYSTADFVGIYPSTAAQLNIVNVTVDGGWQTAQQNSGATYGFVLGNTHHSRISGCHFSNFRVPSVGIVVGSLSSRNIIADNTADLTAGPVVVVNPDAGPNNKLANNFAM